MTAAVPAVTQRHDDASDRYRALFVLAFWLWLSATTYVLMKYGPHREPAVPESR